MNMVLPIATTSRRASPARVLQMQIKDCEKSLDEVLASSSDVFGKAVRVGLLSGTNPTVSQPIIEEMLASLTAGIAMRSSNLRAHEMMDALAKTLNLRELGYGDLVKKAIDSGEPTKAAISADATAIAA